MNYAAAGAAQGLASNKYTPIVIGVLIVGGAVGTYFLAKRGLCAIGLAECATDRRAKRTLKKLQKLDAFNPNFYKNTQLTISHNAAKIKADELEDAFGFWNDDEEGVYRVLQSIATPDDMSLVSKYYGIRHESSLVDDMSYHLDDEDEAKRMWTIVKHLR
jgi:hypothetical protein